MPDYSQMVNRLLGNWDAPARAYNALSPSVDFGGGFLGNFLTKAHQAIDPVNAMGGYGGVLGAVVPPTVSAELNFPKMANPSATFRSAVENTPGASLADNVLSLRVSRRQKPEQALSPSVRGGVFYTPEGAAGARHYTGRYGYGGSQAISGETSFKNPLFTKGATGGKAPETAFDSLMGKGAYETMRRDALSSLGFGKTSPQAVKTFLQKYAPEMTDAADSIIANSKSGNQLPYALQEAAVASAVRRAGHDGVVGYSISRQDKKPFISEIFDVRENKYPSPSGDFSIWPDLQK